MISRAIAWISDAAWLGLFVSRIRVLELLARGDEVLAAAAALISPTPARARASSSTWRAQPYDEIATQENHE